MFDFNRWRANVALPLVFGDSLSFMEMVGKLRYAIENIGSSVVEAISGMNDTIDETVELVNSFDNRIQTNTVNIGIHSDAIDALQSNLEIVETNLGETEQDVANLQRDIEEGIGFKRIAFLGDSFAYSQTTWAELVANNLGNSNYILVRNNNARFLTPAGNTNVDPDNIQTFADLLAANFTQIETALTGFPTDIIVGCGINDSNIIENYTVAQGINNFVNTARRRYGWEKCKIHIVAIGWAESWTQRRNLKAVYSQYEETTGNFVNVYAYRAYYGSMYRSSITNGALNNSGAYRASRCITAALRGNNYPGAGFDAIQQSGGVLVPVVKYSGADTFYVHIDGGEYRLTVNSSDWTLIRSGSQTFFFGTDTGAADFVCPIHEYMEPVGDDPPVLENGVKYLVFRIRTINGSTGLYAKPLTVNDRINNRLCVIPNINYSVDSFSV